MLDLLHAQQKNYCHDLNSSKLLDESSFYDVFIKDLEECLHEVIIECPFITNMRINQLLPSLQKLKDRKVRIIVNTRDPRTHDDGYWRSEAHEAISKLQHRGMQVLFTSNHHRKLAILERHILYEGSLNILSQHNSVNL